ncbi:MAG: hypothetical protein PF569_01155 [Candidatus Woesearchaeota archaeon]|jgi:hypothetical protein|nr:hypothetical protein [Candidatus Woesearchaeota archaeon]
MKYSIFEIGSFEKDLRKLLDNSEYNEYENFKVKLKSGIILGKPLSYEFFREKKIGGKRIYFLVYKEIMIILFVKSSKKSYQQETIDEIKILLPEFKHLAYEIYEKLKKK